MKKSNTAQQQRGFFDFGFSLAILALTGAFAVATTPAEDDEVAPRDAQVEVLVNLEADHVGIVPHH